MCGEEMVGSGRAECNLRQSLLLECETREGLEIQPPDLPASTPSDPLEDFKNDPLIRKALEIFQAEIQPA